MKTNSPSKSRFGACHSNAHRAVILTLLVLGRSILATSADQVLLAAPAGNATYSMYTSDATGASFTLANSFYVSTISVTLYTPSGSSYNVFDFTLQNSLTNPISIFANQNLTASLGRDSTEAMTVDQTLSAGTYFLIGIVPGYAGTTVTQGNVDGWVVSNGNYTQTDGTIANGVWGVNPPPYPPYFVTGGSFVAPAFTVNGSPVPEPTTFALVLAAVFGVFSAFWRRQS